MALAFHDSTPHSDVIAPTQPRDIGMLGLVCDSGAGSTRHNKG
ncbi:hypothetical protein [Labrys monachus]|uniref:Uncharacterized protein n=1 Tax=Labrys monachus TaxID=217067 RepID=A0ABU0FAW4_9HYPH|nr:hypothetical protein [Labrys monachus]MDQ0391763.1 hypothetical protein [Labrys monachus]